MKARANGPAGAEATVIAADLVRHAVTAVSAAGAKVALGRVVTDPSAENTVDPAPPAAVDRVPNSAGKARADLAVVVTVQTFAVADCVNAAKLPRRCPTSRSACGPMTRASNLSRARSR